MKTRKRPARELTHKRDGGVGWKFRKEPLRGGKITFFGRGLELFKTEFFSAQNLRFKRYHQRSRLDLLRLNTLRCTKTAFFNPENPRPFYVGVPGRGKREPVEKNWLTGKRAD